MKSFLDKKLKNKILSLLNQKVRSKTSFLRKNRSLFNNVLEFIGKIHYLKKNEKRINVLFTKDKSLIKQYNFINRHFNYLKNYKYKSIATGNINWFNFKTKFLKNSISSSIENKNSRYLFLFNYIKLIYFI